jgi:hypothetical protein
MFVVFRHSVVAADSGDSRLRYIGGSSYPDITAQEIVTAHENCRRAYRDNIRRLYDNLSEVIEPLLAVVYSGYEWQEFVDDPPPGVFIDTWDDPP